MGDRGNIAIITERNGGTTPEQVWLYSHWGGYDLCDRLRAGLTAGKGRWTDPSYLARIIISHAIPSDAHAEETGYGISTMLQDNEHPILVVDIPAKKVFALPGKSLVKRKVASGATAKTYSFEDFIKSSKDIREEAKAD